MSSMLPNLTPGQLNLTSGYMGNLWQYPSAGAPVTSPGYKSTPISAPPATNPNTANPNTNPYAGYGMGVSSLWGVPNPYSGILAQYGNIPTQAGMLQTARQQVQAGLQSAVAPINIASQLQQMQLGQQATRAQEFAKALNLMNANAPNQLAQQYQQAVGMQGALGQGLTGALASDWQNQTQQAQGQVNQMTQGLPTQTVSSPYDPQNAANVQQVANVAMPAATLGAQGLRDMSALQAQQAGSAGQIGVIANNYLQQLSNAQMQLEGEKAQVYSQAPNMLLQSLSGLRTMRQQQLDAYEKAVQGQGQWEVGINRAAMKNQTDMITADARAQTSQAYSDYLSGKTTTTQYANITQRINDAANAKIKNIQATTGQNVADATAKYHTAMAAAAKERADTAAQLANASLWKNPNTNTIQKIPAGATVGPKGQLIWKPSASGNNPNVPNYTNINQLNTAMQSGIRTYTGINNPVARPTYLNRQEIHDYLMANYGQGFLVRYPGQKAFVEKQINAIANSTATALHKHWLQTQGQGGGGGAGGAGIGANG